MRWPEWPDPKAARAPEVTVALGAGLGGPMVEEDKVGPCGVLLWWLGAWLLPECPTPPWSQEFEPRDWA